jgi:hypothetical protein
VIAERIGLRFFYSPWLVLRPYSFHGNERRIKFSRDEVGHLAAGQTLDDTVTAIRNTDHVDRFGAACTHPKARTLIADTPPIRVFIIAVFADIGAVTDRQEGDRVIRASDEVRLSPEPILGLFTFAQ